MIKPAYVHCQRSHTIFWAGRIYLDYEGNDGVLGIVMARVCTLENAALSSSSGSCCRCSGGLCSHRRGYGGDADARHLEPIPRTWIAEGG